MRPFWSRLPLFSLVLLFLSPALVTAQANKGDGDKDLAEMEHYTLTMDKADRYAKSIGDLATLAQANPKLASKMEGESDESLTGAEHRIASEPQVVAVLQKHGFTPRDFILFGLVLFQSAFASETAKQNGIDPGKAAAQAHVNPANMNFVTLHKAELEAIMARIKEAAANSSSDDKHLAEN